MRWVVNTLNHLVQTMTVVDAHKAIGLHADTALKNQYSQQYLFVEAEGAVIQELVRRDLAEHCKAPAGGTLLKG